MTDYGTAWDACKNCLGEIVGPARSTAPLPEIWLHESGGTSCHRVGHEQPPYLQAARAEPLAADPQPTWMYSVLADMRDFPLGSKLTARLASWGIVTVEDLTKVGWWEERVLPGSERPTQCVQWRGYIPGLIEIKGMGPARLLAVRRFLATYGLKLADEAQIVERENRGLPL